MSLDKRIMYLYIMAFEYHRVSIPFLAIQTWSLADPLICSRTVQYAWPGAMHYVGKSKIYMAS